MSTRPVVGTKALNRFFFRTKVSVWCLLFIPTLNHPEQSRKEENLGIMLIDLLRDNLGLFLPKSRLVDSCFSESTTNKKRQGQGKADSLQKLLPLESVSTESCSTTDNSSDDESIEVQWYSPVREKKTSKIATSLSGPDSDEQGLPVLSTRGSKNLPASSWYYSSNHIMVNNERRRNMVHPLTRKHELDATARWHAENMAAKNRLHHAIPEELQRKVGRPCRIIGKNVYRGESVREIHNKMMESPSDVRNMLDTRYVQFGMGTARGPEGDLFLCQVFIG